MKIRPVLRGAAATTMVGVFAICGSAHSADRIDGIDVVGTELRVRLSSGRVLSGADLNGATLTLTESEGRPSHKVRVQSVSVDPKDPAREILLYHLLAVDEATGKTEELCGPDARGERWAFPVRGQWDADGNHISDAGYTLTCGDGAQGKCVRFGYKPWKKLDDGTDLAIYHQACIRMVRAAYCDGRGTTRNGMVIDVYDSLGINKRDERAGAAGVRFEAAWNAEGAVCVAHTRVPQKVTLEQLSGVCPRLVHRLGEAVCSEEQSRRWGEPVLIFNGSR